MESTEFPITLTTFPRLGSPDCIIPSFPVSGPKLRSQYVPDEIANPHIRFPTLAANIRSRRGRKVEVNVPVFKDENTPWPWNDPTVNYDLHNWPEDDDVRNGAAKENYIYMDAMAFGMGSCCLQITFQAKNIEEGRKMYDQLTPLGPILLALTAATPIYKGFLADTDVRWNQISRAVDDRTPEELGEKVFMLIILFHVLTNLISHSRTIGGAFQSLAMHPTQHTFPRTHAYDQSILILTSLSTQTLNSDSSKVVWMTF
jgi:glutamate--cysteine ligase catalytic subunit